MRGAARQVVGLEHEVRELSADLTRKGHGHAVKRAQRQIHASVQPPATGQKLRMQWGQQVSALSVGHPERHRSRAASVGHDGMLPVRGVVILLCVHDGVDQLGRVHGDVHHHPPDRRARPPRAPPPAKDTRLPSPTPSLPEKRT